MRKSINYHVLPIEEITLEIEKEYISEKRYNKKIFISCSNKLPKTEVTSRFWKGLKNSFSLTENMFELFEPEQILERVVRNHPLTQLFVTTETDLDDEVSKVLGCTKDRNYLITLATAHHHLQFNKAWRVGYEEGVLAGCIYLENEKTVCIGGKTLSPLSVINIPIDGVQRPYLNIGFVVEETGELIIPDAPFFRNYSNFRKDGALVLGNAMWEAAGNIEFKKNKKDTENNEKKNIAVNRYSVLAGRLENAYISWATIADLVTIEELLISLNVANIEERLEALALHPREAYHLTNLNVLSKQKQERAPVGCTVYDLILFLSGLITSGEIKPKAAFKVNKFIGNLISEEYSLAGTAKDKKLPEIFDKTKISSHIEQEILSSGGQINTGITEIEPGKTKTKHSIDDFVSEITPIKNTFL